LKKVVIYGNGSVASATYFMLVHDSPYQICAFTVDYDFIKDDSMFDLPVVPFDLVDQISLEEYNMHIAVGHVRVNRIRAQNIIRPKKWAIT
jgi:hypothetical protein